MLEQEMIHKIGALIREYGVLINTAKSKFGMDIWKLGKNHIGIYEDGTYVLIAPNFYLTVAECYGKIEYTTNGPKELKALYDTLFPSEI